MRGSVHVDDLKWQSRTVVVYFQLLSRCFFVFSSFSLLPCLQDIVQALANLPKLPSIMSMAWVAAKPWPGPAKGADICGSPEGAGAGAEAGATAAPGGACSTGSAGGGSCTAHQQLQGVLAAPLHEHKQWAGCSEAPQRGSNTTADHSMQAVKVDVLRLHSELVSSRARIG